MLVSHVDFVVVRHRARNGGCWSIKSNLSSIKQYIVDQKHIVDQKQLIYRSHTHVSHVDLLCSSNRTAASRCISLKVGWVGRSKQRSTPSHTYSRRLGCGQAQGHRIWMPITSTLIVLGHRAAASGCLVVSDVDLIVLGHRAAALCMLVCVGHVDLLVVGHRAAASACWSPRLACRQAQAVSRRIGLKVEPSVYQNNKLILTSYLAPSTEPYRTLRNPNLPCSSKSSEPDLIVAKWLRELCFTEGLITLYALTLYALRKRVINKSVRDKQPKKGWRKGRAWPHSHA